MRRDVGSLGVVMLLALFVSGGQPAASAAAAEAPTFARDVASILYDSCVSCHRPGEIAPMSLLTYQDARPWARAIKSKVVSREMPPWHADRATALPFRNAPSLSQAAIDTIVAWVDAGAPPGNMSDMPPAPTFLEGWQHPSGRSPDFIVPMPVEYTVPAEGGIPYVNFHAKLPLTDDVYAEAVETRPGNRAVVHHASLNRTDFDEPPPPGPVFAEVGATTSSRPRPTANANRADGNTTSQTENVRSNRRPRSARIGLFTPGAGFEWFPSGTGLRVHGGPTAYIRFNMHYQLTGRPETDRSSLAIWLQRGPVQFEMVRNRGIVGTILAEGQELLAGTPGLRATGTYAVIPTIPAGADNFETVGVTPFAADTTIYQFNPHAHLRGKDFTYTLVYPDGREEMLLHVPRYDFNWQLIYELEEPFVAPAGSKLVMTAHYDNSHKNRYNPAPDRDVIWAEQSWEEMFIPFVVYATEPEEDAAAKSTTQENQE